MMRERMHDMGLKGPKKSAAASMSQKQSRHGGERFWYLSSEAIYPKLNAVVRMC